MSKQFVITAVGSCAAIVCGVGLINCLCDPYGLNRAVLATGFNFEKPESATHARLWVAGMITERRPDVVAFGTSRTLRGISMEHPGWKGAFPERYNAAVMSANGYELMRYFEHAERTRRLRQAVIGLDLFSYNAYKPNGVDFSEALLSSYGRAVEGARAIELLKIYCSNDTLAASWRTVRGNLVHSPAPFLEDGRENPRELEASITLGGGQHQAFMLSARVALTNLNFPLPLRTASLRGEHGEYPLRYLKRILEIARQEKTDLRLFISPAHARQWEALRVAGLWGEFEQWKREMVEILGEDAAMHPDALPIPLWDFSGYSALSTEEVPVANDVRSRMKWYWESSHYRSELGDLVLDRILGYQGARAAQDDFGVLLTKENIESHLERIRLTGAAYRRSHPRDIAQIEAVARSIPNRPRPREQREER